MEVKMKNLKAIHFAFFVFFITCLIPSIVFCQPALKLPFEKEATFICTQGNLMESYSASHYKEKIKTRYGLDFNMSSDPVVASAPGFAYGFGGCVKGYSGCNGGWGNYVKIDHGDGFYTLYAHL